MILSHVRLPLCSNTGMSEKQNKHESEQVRVSEQADWLIELSDVINDHSSCGRLAETSRQTDWLTDTDKGLGEQRAFLNSSLIINPWFLLEIFYYTNISAYLIFLTWKWIRRLQIMVWFSFQWFTKPTLTQHPGGESDMTKRRHTHTFSSALQSSITHTHTHTHLQYTLNTAWRTAVFGPDAVFWLSLTRPNTTSCAPQTFNH